MLAVSQINCKMPCPGFLF
uniref:Uncharacterized protein n=1 Tax=Arundo donax TaxID=35708 RepID=A0A0A9G956_ARUDO